MNKLTKTQIDNLFGKRQHKQLELTDGNNLYLIVTKIGSCKFKYRIRTQSKASWVVIGDYPDITLNEARKKALEIRAQIASGVNPNSVKRDEQSRVITVSKLATIYFSERLPIVRPKEHSAKQFIRAVKKDIVEIIGETLVKDITIDLIKNQLINTKLTNGSPSVARRTRNNIKILLDFAIERNIITNNPATLIKASNIYRDKPRKRHLSHDELKLFINLVQ